jgi:hypothetical protein
MRYLGLLLFCTLALTFSAEAQSRGMGMRPRSFGPMTRSAPGPARVGVFRHPGAPPFGSITVHPHGPFGPSFGGRRFSPRHFGGCHPPFCRRIFFHGGSFNSFDTFGAFPYSYGLPIIGYGYADSDYSASAPQQDEAINQLSNELAEERRRREELETEVERLQHPQSPVTGEVQQSAPGPEPAVLVFRDGTQKEVENYAIFGSTLFAFVPEGTNKIRIADLNLPATQKANEERGIDFQLPREGQLSTYP